MKRLLQLLPVLGILLLVTCSKDKDKGNNVSAVVSVVDSLKSKDVVYLDNLSSSSYTISDAILPNGRSVYDFLLEKDPSFIQNLGSSAKSASNITVLGPQDTKNLIIAKMQAMAFYLTDRTIHSYPSEGENKPAQVGLAYSYGSKNYKVRQTPPAGSCNEFQLYGLDCSGFIYQLATVAGLQFPSGNAETQRKVDTWKNAFKANSEYSKLKMQDFGQLSISELESGDIIYWTENGVAKHIGIVLNSVDGLAVFQSNGAASVTCDKNYTVKRGPNQIKLQNLNWFGNSYGVVRIITDISGEYTAYFRCTNQVNDALTINISFPTNTTGTFKANGTGTDYDGSPIKAVFDGTYNNKTNTLSGILTMTFPNNPTDIRKDSFQKRLDFDDTGYISMTMELVNGGCAMDIRLINDEIMVTQKSHSTEINNECTMGGK